MAVKHEVTMELLTDLQKAVEAIWRQTVPSLPARVVLLENPPRLVLTVLDEDAAVYGTIHSAKAHLTVTTRARRILGLPEEN